MTTQRKIMTNILVVDDEPPIRQLLRLVLTRQGYQVEIADCSAQAFRILQNNSSIDLVLLDWMLPDTSGIKLLTQLRSSEEFAELPVIMLTAKAEESNVLRGFGMGADDYITKPFSPKELVMRVQSLLKRVKPKGKAEKKLCFYELCMNLESHELCIKDQVIKCGRLEFKLLAYLIQNIGKTLSRDHILMQVWQADKDITARTVDVHITRIRKLLAPFAYDQCIRSVRGEGYQLVDREPVC